MTDRFSLSRRTLLRGVGAGLALPWLEAMGPLSSWLRTRRRDSGGLNRMAFVYVPNGVHIPDWTPQAEGTSFDLPRILQPLAAVKDDLLVLTGLTADKSARRRRRRSCPRHGRLPHRCTLAVPGRSR